MTVQEQVVLVLNSTNECSHLHKDLSKLPVKTKCHWVTLWIVTWKQHSCIFLHSEQQLKTKGSRGENVTGLTSTVEPPLNGHPQGTSKSGRLMEVGHSIEVHHIIRIILSRNITSLKQTCDGRSITGPQSVVTFSQRFFPSSYILFLRYISTSKFSM